MKFTVLGHGALSVEAGGRRLLVDPWLSGSCYWRSWWHYPPSQVQPEDLTPDFVYLSHHHFDHFHYPSMRQLDRHAVVLVPKFAVDVMPGEVRGLGFEHVVELPHGEVLELTPDLRVCSFQYGFDDSALLVESQGVVLADFNDCKVRGRALGEVLETFGRPTFLFKSHSWAQGYPVRYLSEDPAQLGLVSRESYVADFVEAVELVQPGYAIPFASMVCFLHPQTAHMNDHVVTPPEVAEGYAASPVPGSEVVVMTPGDSWDITSGFALGDVDWFDPERRADTLVEMQEEARPAYEAAMVEEALRSVAWDDFRAFFERFVRSLPPGAARLLMPRPVTFWMVRDEMTPAWTIDARHRTVRRSSDVPADAASVITVPEGVLAQAIADKVVNLIHISLRLQVELRPGGVDADLGFWGLLAIWELGYLPLHRVPRRRLASTVWRRRREFWELATTRLLGRGSMAERMTAGLITRPDAPS
ncbi:MAG: Zn-dependent hydrolase of the beta-lactamase fold [Actinomycetia bacterium]|nr:Zn-dependent hydrolase of the beta-lactamase fold [Actinomycetes bacterium]